MRQPYVHEALLVMGQADDSGAPGAAITTRLCGSWDHEGACPLAPHHTRVARDGERLRVRVLFAVEPTLEAEVRRRIVEALTTGQSTASGNDPVRWNLRHHTARGLTASELEHATRLAQERDLE